MIEIVLDVGRKNPIKVVKTEGNCWECTSHKPMSNGRYYQITVGSRTDGTRRPIMLHRFIYEYNVGEIEEGLVLRHTCDNDMCVNPEHLLKGTHQDNSDDMVRRGRVAKGKRVASSKLTDQEVLEIRDLYSKTEYTQSQIANIYGVSQRQISNIVRHINR